MDKFTQIKSSITFYLKNCFHNINDGSLEVHCNKKYAIYWNFIFHDFVGKFTLLLSGVLYIFFKTISHLTGHLNISIFCYYRNIPKYWDT